jgi:diguanylate cyclase (GGDEF)-like protein/PAS domain S-box-containing protein
MKPQTPKILAIDDTPANLLTLGAALSKDFDLQIATSGPMGLALAQENPPDLILLDIMMPDMDGFEVCRRLKDNPALNPIPVIFVTAMSELDAEAKGLALGAVDYITKPINVEIARQRIRNLIVREHLRKEVEVQRDQLDSQVTALKNSERQLQLAASVFTYAREAIMITSANGTIVDVNNAFTHITGYSRDESVGKNPRILSSGKQDADFYSTMWRDLSSKGHWYGEVWNRRKSGEVFAVMQTISTVRDGQGRPDHYVSLFSDITASKTHQQELEHIAHYDALTGLPNRALLADRMRQALSQSQRRGQLVAVVFLDLDGFKSVNDLHGHEVGDHLLISLAKRMRQALRDGDTLARVGGDEFVAVLVDLNEISACVPMLTRMLAAASQAIPVGDLTLRVSASLGVTFTIPGEESDADLLLRQADQAMYQAKLTGKNRYHVFDADQDRSVRGHHESLDHIRRGLEKKEFVLYYQPKVDMRQGRVIGAEALIRWQHPERGLLLPGVFLPTIEDHPLSVDIGEWVIETAIQQTVAWQKIGLHVPVSVNVGARQLQQEHFVDRLRMLLVRYPELPPGQLELEILETSALEDVAGVSAVIEACHSLGIKFALDDFGTGYSSLTYLKRLPVAMLKIDQSFVRDMLVDPDDLAILEGVIGLATAFRSKVIAEGVETVAHGSRLLQLGCDNAQGYGVARPMPAEEFPLWVKNWRPDAAWSQVLELEPKNYQAY